MAHQRDGFSESFRGVKINSTNKAYVNTLKTVPDARIEDDAIVLVELMGLRPSTGDYYVKKKEFMEELVKYKNDPLKFEAAFTRMRKKIFDSF